MAEVNDPTAAEFEAALKRAAAEQPEMVIPLLSTAVLSCLKKLEAHGKLSRNIVKGLATIAQKAGVVTAPNATSAVAGAAAEVAGAAAAAGERKGADGQPLTPHEAAVEAMMDNAVVDNEGSGIAPPPQAAGKPAGRRLVPQRPQIVGGNGGSTRVGADGAPLTPHEAAIEDMMDNAVVDNS